jgi:prevent-host-death family protein
MKEVGIRELKEHASAIIRRVREEREEVAVTHRGRVVAMIVPAGATTARREDLASIWAEMDRLAEEIGELWPEGVSAVQAVSEDRR